MLSPICKRRTGASLPWFSWQNAPRTAASTCSRLATPTQNLAIAATPPAQYHEDHSQPDRKRSPAQPPASYVLGLQAACSSQRSPILGLDRDFGFSSGACQTPPPG